VAWPLFSTCVLVILIQLTHKTAKNYKFGEHQANMIQTRHCFRARAQGLIQPGRDVSSGKSRCILFDQKKAVHFFVKNKNPFRLAIAFAVFYLKKYSCRQVTAVKLTNSLLEQSILMVPTVNVIKTPWATAKLFCQYLAIVELGGAPAKKTQDNSFTKSKQKPQHCSIQTGTQVQSHTDDC